MKQFIHNMIELLPVLAVAMFGGVTRTIAGKARGEPYSLKIAIPEIVIAIFAGLLVHWITSEIQISEGYRTAAIALAGYSSRSILAICNAVFIDLVKRHLGGLHK